MITLICSQSSQSPMSMLVTAGFWILDLDRTYWAPAFVCF